MDKALSKWIISASGWRTVFACSKDEQDKTTNISKENSYLLYLAAQSFSEYIKKKYSETSKDIHIVLGTDTRPTGKVIAYIFNNVLNNCGITVHYTGITAAPEIMVFAKKYSGFVYISASHNPIGHNGIKFGLSDGGVLPGSEANTLAENFKNTVKNYINSDKYQQLKNIVDKLLADYNPDDFICNKDDKQNCVNSYFDFTKEVITDSKDLEVQMNFFNTLKEKLTQNKITILADMNGSARTLSIDSDFFNYCGLGYKTINNVPGQISHEIIPEPENLVYLAQYMESLQKSGQTDGILGYMPDCDGDRGNIVFWNHKSQKAEILKAQEVFALCVMSELASIRYNEKLCNLPPQKLAVAVNDPTSMRIDKIAEYFNAEVFRAEVGEANVVNLARKLRDEGYTVRILGEGSNGGNITHPAAVRDPLNTLFSLIKLLAMPDIFKLWCQVSNNQYVQNPTLKDIQQTLPVYTTTGVTDSRAVLRIHTLDHSLLKSAYQSVLELQWQNVGASFMELYGIASYQAVSNNGIIETSNLTDFSKSGRGGLKILLKDIGGNVVAFVWMRGSGTEPVFRVMCDVKGDNPELEKILLQWHTKMIIDADAFA